MTHSFVVNISLWKGSIIHIDPVQGGTENKERVDERRERAEMVLVSSCERAARLAPSTARGAINMANRTLDRGKWLFPAFPQFLFELCYRSSNHLEVNMCNNANRWDNVFPSTEQWTALSLTAKHFWFTPEYAELYVNYTQNNYLYLNGILRCESCIGTCKGVALFFFLLFIQTWIWSISYNHNWVIMPNEHSALNTVYSARRPIQLMTALFWLCIYIKYP